MLSRLSGRAKDGLDRWWQIKSQLFFGDQTEQGTITLSIEADHAGEGVIISVADNGKGMSKEKVDSIFQNINRNNGVQISGDGMALANVERRLQLYYNPEQIIGISITSEENKGTVIQFKIPIIK